MYSQDQTINEVALVPGEKLLVFIHSIISVKNQCT